MSGLGIPTKIYDWITFKLWKDNMTDSEKQHVLKTMFSQKVYEYDLPGTLKTKIENGDLSLPAGTTIESVLNKSDATSTAFFDTQTLNILNEKVEQDPDLAEWPTREWSPKGD